jgi:branched-chain amino acid transport system permease protein
MYYVELFILGLIDGSMYALMAIGLTLIYGLLRILHVAHAGVFVLGAYVGVFVTNTTGSFLLGFLLAIPVGGLFGMAIYRFIYHPLLDKSPVVALIASIGLFIVMEDGYRLIFGPYGESYLNPPMSTTFNIAGIMLSAVQIAMVAISVLFLLAFAIFIGRTRIGVAWRATVSSPEMAASFGVDPMKVRYVNFFIGSSLAAVAGVMVGVLNNLVEPTMGFVVSYKTLAIIVLGGLGSVRGTLIASFGLGIIEAFGTIFIGHILDRDAIAFLFLIALLMLRPQGLLGQKV